MRHGKEPSLEVTPSLRLSNYCFLSDESYTSCATLNYGSGRVTRTSLSAVCSAVRVDARFPDEPRPGSPPPVICAHVQRADRNSNLRDLGVNFSFNKR